MRRTDREIKEFEEIVKVMEKCEVCRLAFHDGGYPYILPLNFGMKVEGEKITLYFHGALEGKKYRLMAADNRVGFAKRSWRFSKRRETAPWSMKA